MLYILWVLTDVEVSFCLCSVIFAELLRVVNLCLSQNREVPGCHLFSALISLFLSSWKASYLT